MNTVLSLKKSSFIQKMMLSIPFWITPNSITLFRGLLTIPVAYELVFGEASRALLFLAIALLLDFVDGALAHARRAESKLGAFLDPLMDKIIVTGTLLGALIKIKESSFFLPMASKILDEITGCIIVVAVLLTFFRIGVWLDVSDAHIKATSSGKQKFLAECIGTITLVLAIALISAPLLYVSLGFLFISIPLAILSLYSQVKQIQ